MGYKYMFIVAAVVFAGGTLFASQRTAKFEQEGRQAGYESAVLAREIAQSGMNILKSDVMRSFNSHRPSAKRVGYRGGDYTLNASGDSKGPVEITSTATYGDATHSISAKIYRKNTFLDALTVDGPMDDVRVSGSSFKISGRDTNPGASSSGGGPMVDMYAVRSISSATNDLFASKLPLSTVQGPAGESAFSTGQPEADLEALVNQVLGHSDRVELTGNHSFKDSQVYGSATNPVIMVVDGDLELAGSVHGYGILYVRGEFKMAGDAVWEGLVLVQPDGGLLNLDQSATVYGAVVALTEADAGAVDAGLPGGHFDVDVFDGPTTSKEYHEHEYDDDFDVTWVDLASPGCGNGGLCFNNLVMSHTEVRAEFFNSGSASGTFTFTAGAVSVAGDVNDGFSTTFDPTDLTDFMIDFNSLCAFRGTSPGDVQGDIANRDNAFAVRMYDTGTNDMIYELAVYHHRKDDECIGEGEGGFTGVPFEFKIEDTAAIYYSSTTLMRLKNLLPSIDLGEMTVAEGSESSSH